MAAALHTVIGRVVGKLQKALGRAQDEPPKVPAKAPVVEKRDGPSKHKGTAEPFNCTKQDCWCKKDISQRFKLEIVDKQLLEAAFNGTLGLMVHDAPVKQHSSKAHKSTSDKGHGEPSSAKHASSSPHSKENVNKHNKNHGNAADKPKKDRLQGTVLRQLLDRKANLNTFDRNGISALHYAARSLRAEEVHLLVKKAKADVTIADAFGNTPLHFFALAAAAQGPAGGGGDDDSDGGHGRDRGGGEAHGAAGGEKKESKFDRLLKIIGDLEKNKGCMNCVGKRPVDLVQDAYDSLDKYKSQQLQLKKAEESFFGGGNPLVAMVLVKPRLRASEDGFNAAMQAGLDHLTKLKDALTPKPGKDKK